MSFLCQKMIGQQSPNFQGRLAILTLDVAMSLIKLLQIKQFINIQIITNLQKKEQSVQT